MSSTLSPNPALSSVQTQIAAALARGASISAAAREAGVHRTTLYNWIESIPGFAAAVQQARDDHADRVRDSLRDLEGLALTRLRTLLENPDTPPSIQLKAALAVLQRPHFPKDGWHLPERVEPPSQQRALDDLADVRAEYDRMRMADKLAKPPPGPAPVATQPAVARNAPCPCGANQKYKRCCGRNAPAQYSDAA